MDHIESFDSFEEMMERLGQQAEAAKAKASEKQWKIADGKAHYFLRLVELAGTPYLIVGEVFDAEKKAAENKERFADEYEEGEWEHEVEQTKARLKDGFVFTRSYSIIEPNGELGDVHVSTMLEIPYGLFVAARAMGYNIPVIMHKATQLTETKQPDEATPEEIAIAMLAVAIADWIENVHYQ